MKTLKRFAMVAMALAIATPALAGTKFQTNLVSNDPIDPPSNPTISPKSSIKMSDKGSIQVGLAGVTDGAGTLVTTSGSYNDTFAVDGTQYVAIIKLRLPAIEGLFPIVELPIAVDLKGGKGKTKYSAAPLFGFLGAGNGRTVEIQGVEVWGPLGGGAAACQAILSAPIPVIFPPDPSCRSGNEIGMSGLAVPLP